MGRKSQVTAKNGRNASVERSQGQSHTPGEEEAIVEWPFQCIIQFGRRMLPIQDFLDLLLLFVIIDSVISEKVTEGSISIVRLSIPVVVPPTRCPYEKFTMLSLRF
jgi:hypothetical protein